MNLVPRRVKHQPPPPRPEDAIERAFTFADWLSTVGFGGVTYGTASTWSSPSIERTTASFENWARLGYGDNAIVFSLVDFRAKVLSEARFQFQERAGNRAGDLFGSGALRILEQPWPGGTAAELVAKMEVDASLAGNSYWVRRGDRLARLRPDRVAIVIGVPGDPTADPAMVDAEVVGYIHQRGPGPDDVDVFTAAEVAHYSPVPDPLASFRGMSWLQPVIREISLDHAITSHATGFFERGAALTYAIKLPKGYGADSSTVAKRVSDTFSGRHGGVANQHRALVLSDGMDIQTVGSTFRDADLKVLRGAGESRLAAAAGVPPVMVGFSEGLAAATYSNYSQARRRFADGTARPLWRSMADALAVLVDMPTPTTRLVVDTSEIAFLREDEKERAETLTQQAASIRQLIDAGFAPDAAVGAVTAGDLRGLSGQHSGLYSVQLQRPGADQTPGLA